MATQWPLSRPFKRHITFYLHEMEWNRGEKEAKGKKRQRRRRRGGKGSEGNGRSGELNDSGNESRSSNIYPIEKETNNSEVNN